MPPLDQAVLKAFTDGYLLAMTKGMQEMSQRLVEQAIEDTLARIDSLVEERARRLHVLRPRALMDVQAKQEQFRSKLLTVHDAESKAKYTHYLEALDWALNANGLLPHQPVSE